MICLINRIEKDFDEIFNMTKYQNKYRISSHRKPKWDYSANALYFLTIITQGRKCNLGTISKTDDGAYQIMLSDFGNIVETEWFKSFEIRDELILHAFILMPNHLHAIVEINNINMGDDGYHNYVETHGRVSTNHFGTFPFKNKTESIHSFAQINFVIYCRIQIGGKHQN